jgi:hypothetical protein
VLVKVTGHDRDGRLDGDGQAGEGLYRSRANEPMTLIS